jgi:hypothetical protein
LYRDYKEQPNKKAWNQQKDRFDLSVFFYKEKLLQFSSIWL